MRRLRSCNASRNWTDNSRRRKRETISESRNRVGTWGSHREWHLDLRQQIRRGADQRSFYLHNSQEQCRRGRFAGGCGITRQLEGTTRFDTDSVAGLDRPWSDRRRCAFPLVLPGAVFCFRSERVTSSKDALYLGSPARSTTSQRAPGTVAGARASHSRGGSIPPSAAHPLGRLGHGRNIHLNRDMALGCRDHPCQKSTGVDESTHRRAGSYGYWRSGDVGLPDHHWTRGTGANTERHTVVLGNDHSSLAHG